jgi:hypothetical protein
MQFLLSGFIGALIAATISVVYLYLSEQSRLRSEVTLGVVGYFHTRRKTSTLQLTLCAERFP